MSGFVYFIRCGDFVKVGFSTNPKARLRYLVTGSPHQLELVVSYPGTVADEADLHRMLSAHHHCGEWFRACPEIDDLIKHGLPRSDAGPLRGWKLDLQRAVGKLGSQHRLAEAMGCSQAKISWLLLTAETLSAEDALAVDRATDGDVSASDLRPDLWPTKLHVPTVAHERAAS